MLIKKKKKSDAGGQGGEAGLRHRQHSYCLLYIYCMEIFQSLNMQRKH